MTCIAACWHIPGLCQTVGIFLFFSIEKEQWGFPVWWTEPNFIYNILSQRILLIEFKNHNRFTEK